MDWKSRTVLVGGGASFIGSHPAGAIIERAAKLRTVDNASSRLENIHGHPYARRIEFINADVLKPGIAGQVVEGIDIVFHLAANHGGRGYVDLHQAACATNLTLDGMLSQAFLKARVQKVNYASSLCVNPNYLQTDPN